MKNNKSLIYILVLSFICYSIPTFAETKDSKKATIDFLYIHGVGMYDETAKKKFEGMSQRLNTVIANRFNQNELIKEVLLENNKYKVNNQAQSFFWGDLVKDDIELLNKRLKETDNLVGKIQNVASSAMYTGFWLGKTHNKNKVTEKLHQQINKAKNTDNLVILGHSAGSMVTYFYILNRLPYLDLYKQGKKDRIDKRFLKVFEDEQARHSCVQALLASKTARFNRHGKLVLFTDGLDISNKELSQKFKKQFVNDKVQSIAKFNKQYCIPQKQLKGIVTFGSPLAGITSESNDAEGISFKKELMSYLIRNGIFWLHVNHRDDSIGFPIDDQRILKAFSEELDFENDTSNLHRGFFRNFNATSSGATMLKAHEWYFDKPSAFAWDLIRAYEQGYENFND